MNVPPGNKNKATILVVDDIAANLSFLSAVLSRHGYRAKCVSNGAMALSEVHSNPPDLILLDIKMPDMDGYEVCKQLKADPQTRDIPVIFISALDEVLDKVKAFSVGGVDYLTKPFQFEEVLARVENHLTIRNLQKKLEEKDIHLQKEISARQEAEAELQRLNAELEQRVLQRTLQLGAEQERSERLLFNILPQSVVERLKLTQDNIADNFKDVTVLFADIVNFTQMSANFTSDETVSLLDQVFTAFDNLVEKHGLEKIKTIGDAYLVVGGLPEERADHAKAVAEMALAMQREVKRLSKKLSHPVQVRIGLNSGPVTAGIIGKKKFIYDLWGDTVNIASRMESHGLAGTIQVTEETYNRLKDSYAFEERGLIEVKGKGKMKAYLLKGRLAKS